MILVWEWTRWRAEKWPTEKQIFERSPVLTLRDAFFPTTREWSRCPGVTTAQSHITWGLCALPYVRTHVSQTLSRAWVCVHLMVILEPEGESCPLATVEQNKSHWECLWRPGQWWNHFYCFSWLFLTPGVQGAKIQCVLDRKKGNYLE